MKENFPVKAKSIFLWIVKAFVAGVVAVFVLSAVAFFYNYTGMHIANPTKATDYSWQKNQIMFNMKEGFSFVKMDENGFNNSASVADKPVDILLMGSSHMESYQVNGDENCGYLLNEYLPEYYTYNIGVSGHTIYRIADNIDDALAEHKPSKYVLIETNTVWLDCHKMNEVISGNASAIESYDSGILFYLQKIPAFKPIYNQLDNWLHILPASDNYPSGETVVPDEYKPTLLKFLSVIGDNAERHGVTPIIFYAPNEFLNDDATVTYQTDDKYLEIYKEVCEELNIVFVDLSDSFASLYNEQKILAHGFPNSAVGTGHLNKYGHKAVAETLAAEIRKREVK